MRGLTRRGPTAQARMRGAVGSARSRDQIPAGLPGRPPPPTSWAIPAPSSPGRFAARPRAEPKLPPGQLVGPEAVCPELPLLPPDLWAVHDAAKATAHLLIGTTGKQKPDRFTTSTPLPGGSGAPGACPTLVCGQGRPSLAGLDTGKLAPCPAGVDPGRPPRSSAGEAQCQPVPG